MNFRGTPGPWCRGDSDLPVSQMAVCGSRPGRKHSTIARLIDAPFVEAYANQTAIILVPKMIEALVEFKPPSDHVHDTCPCPSCVLHRRAQAIIRRLQDGDAL